MRKNKLKEKWAAGETVLNCWLSIGSAYSAELLGHQGFDSVTVDLQHGMIGFETALSMLQAISSTPSVPLARVAENHPASIMRLLDAGAYGIICPVISTEDEARAFVSACRYPQRGTRSFGPARGLLYGGPDYFEHADDEILAIAMLETACGLKNLDGLVTLEGLDGFYVGPNDLALSLGAPPVLEPTEGPAAEALRQISTKARAAGKFVGTHAISPAGMKRRSEEGYNLLTPAGDVAFLTQGAKMAISNLKAAISR